ncbi:MAG: CBS domain-containing protein [Bacteroidota bacterium]
MNLHDQIISTLPMLDVTDTLDKAISFFGETTFSHVAVEEKGVFLGMLSEQDLPCFEPEKTVDEFKYQLEHFFVTKETLWLDVLEKFSANEANLLPILDTVSKRVLGYYNLSDVVSIFIGTPFFTEPGGILVISKGIKDHSMSEIAQIVESNNGKLLGTLITDQANDMVQVTLKINSANFNEVLQTFRRYGYQIVFGNNDDQFLEDLKERSAYLDKYLNV